MSKWIFVVIALLSLFCGGGCSQTRTPSKQAQVNHTDCGATSPYFADSLVSPNGQLIVFHQLIDAGWDSVEIQPTGGGRPVLTFTNSVLDLYWLPGSDGIVYSVGPIYGTPGIFLREIGSKKVLTIVKPEIKNTAYPDGADFIRLCGVNKVDSTTILDFARFGDVDKVNFENPPAPVIQQIRVPKSTVADEGKSGVE